MPLLDRDRVANLNSLPIRNAGIVLAEGERAAGDVPIRDECIIEIADLIDTSDLTRSIRRKWIGFVARLPID